MRRLTIVTLTAVSLITASSPAQADTAVDARQAIERDCQDGKMNGVYSQKQYSDALRNLQTDLDEYSDCRRVIRSGQLAAASTGRSAAAGGGGSAAGASGSEAAASPGAPFIADVGALPTLATASPAERAKLDEARKTGGEGPIVIDGKIVRPSALTSPAGASTALPVPLLVVLALLGLGLGLGAAQALRVRVTAWRRST